MLAPCEAVLTIEGAAAGETNSDAFLLEAAVGREAVDSTLGVQLYNPAAVGDDSIELESTFSLVADLSGLAVGLQTTPAASEVVVTQNFTLEHGARLTLPITAELRPAAELDPALSYRVVVSLRSREVGGTLWSAPTVYTEAGRKWVHFTNTMTDDASLNIKAFTGVAVMTDLQILQSVAGQESFAATVPMVLHRYDIESAPQPAVMVPVTYHLTLVQNGTQIEVPLENPTITVQRSVAARDVGNPGSPFTDTWTQTLNFTPAAGAVVLPTVNYRLGITVEMQEPDNSSIVVTPALTATDKSRFLVLSGALNFGGVQTVFTVLGNDPSPLMVLSGGVYSTQLAVTQGSAAAAPTRRYGDGTLLDVTYDPVTGDAVVTGGTQHLTTAEPDIVGIHGLRFQRGVIRLDFSGALLESGGIWFPAGFGVSTTQHSRRHQASLPLLQEPLQSDLLPPFETKEFSPPVGLDFYAYCDRLPLQFKTEAITWDVKNGQLSFKQSGTVAPLLARQDQENALAALSMSPGAENAEPRPSNDAFLKNITDQSDITIAAGASGQALLSASLTLGSGQMETHFPQGLSVDWLDGQFDIVENAIQSSSFLAAHDPVTISYRRDCSRGCTTTAGDGQFVCRPTDWLWKFTADGGIKADVITVSERLRWGTTQLAGGGSPPGGGSAFAMQTSQWSEGVFHAPGTWLAGDSAPEMSEATRRPEAMLLSGVLVDGSFERPESLGYSAGLGDYAGLNFRAGVGGNKTGRSVLAGILTENYDLKARSKYYVRASGVTGIHETSALIPSTLPMYGFNVDFDGLRLAYLDGLNMNSETGGSIHVKSPVNQEPGFDLAFKHLQFECQGQPTKMQLATEGEVKTLDYWGANIVPLTMEFVNPISNTGCVGVDEGFLLVSVETAFPSVSVEKLYATLGFMSDGNLVTKSNPLSNELEVDSRFTLPPNIEVLGPGGVPWQVTVVGKAYLNNPDPSYPTTPPSFERPDHGFLTFPATMNLPWFQDMKVQFHVSSGASANANSVMHIMGGWPNNPKEANIAGWEESGTNYFTDKLFDSDHVGFDTQLNGTVIPVSVETYRNPPKPMGNDSYVTNPYRPRAEKTWLDVVSFNFPLKWDTIKRRFSSYDQVADLIVLGEMHRQVKTLTPSSTELTFGVQLDIPRINTQNLVGEVTEGLTVEFASGMADAATDALGTVLLGQLTDGMGSLDQLLSERYNGVLDAPLATEADLIYDDITNGIVDPGTLKTNLRARLTSMGADVGIAVNGRLSQGLIGVGAAREMLAVGGGENFHLVGELVKELLERNPSGAITNAETALAELMPEISDDLAQTDEILARVQAAMVKAQAHIGNQVFAVFQETAPALNLVADKAIDEILLEVNSPRWMLLSHSARQARVRRIVQDRAMGSVMVPKLQLIVRQHVQDANELFRAAFDDVLGDVNHLVRGVITATGGAVGASVRNETVGAMGPPTDGSNEKGKLAGIDIEGYAQINDESLRELTINGKFEFNVPDSLRVQAHMKYKEYDTDTPPEGCRSSRGDKMATIEIRAQAECDWCGAADRTVVGIGSKFTLLGGVPVGFDGYFDFKGNVTVGPVAVKEIRLFAGFGSLGTSASTWAYLGGSGRGEYGGHEASAGIFLGRTCNSDVLKMVDPTAELALKQSGWVMGSPVTGVYLYGEAWFPLNEVFGIPSTCLLTLKAGGGSGFFGFIGETNEAGIRQERLFVGCKQLYGVEGTILCALKARGSVVVFGSVALNLPPFLAGENQERKNIFEQVVNPDIILGGSYLIHGDASFSIRFGICPICKDVSKSFGVTWKLPKSLSFDF